jgi:hypothetical protein
MISIGRRDWTWEDGRYDGTHMKSYWQQRRKRNRKYYDQTIALARKHAPRARNYLDVGNYGCEYVYEMDWIADKTVLDIRDEILSLDDRVKKLKVDLLQWEPDSKFDLVTCLQVLEHFEDPRPFIDKLHAVCADVLIISLPYMWKAGETPDHKHDPIGLDLIHAWLGDDASEETVATEDNGVERWIGVFKTDKTRWPKLSSI